MRTDVLLKETLSDCKKWIFSYHEHDDLLENKIVEELSEEERRVAWTDYEADKFKFI